MPLLIVLMLFSACAGRRISPNQAEAVIAESLRHTLEKDDIDLQRVISTSGSVAIVETRLKTAFRLEKEGNEWTVKDIRLGDGRWENVAAIERALEIVKTEETEKMLDRISAAISSFAEEYGRMPDFTDYVSLSDQLSPRFLTPLIRLDAWRRPLYADKVDENTIILRSAGADGAYETAGDIRRIVRR